MPLRAPGVVYRHAFYGTTGLVRRPHPTGTCYARFGQHAGGLGGGHGPRSGHRRCRVRAGSRPGSTAIPAVFALERERLFTRTWQFLAHESEIPRPGDFVVRRILDDSFIVSRDERGEVHVLLNMCRHRGMQVCRAEAGHASPSAAPTTPGPTATTAGSSACPSTPRPTAATPALDKDTHGLVHAPARRLVPRPGLRQPRPAGAAPGGRARRLPLLPRLLPPPEPRRRRAARAAALARPVQLEDRRRELRRRLVPHAPHPRDVVDIGLFREPTATSARRARSTWPVGAAARPTSCRREDARREPRLRRLPAGDGRADARGVDPRAPGHGRPGPASWSRPPRCSRTSASCTTGRRSATATTSCRSCRSGCGSRSSATETECLLVVRRGPQRAGRLQGGVSTRPTCMCFGTSGMFEQDDVENWTSITNMAKGRLGVAGRARQHDGHGARRRHPGRAARAVARRRARPSSATASTTSAALLAWWAQLPGRPGRGVTARRGDRSVAGTCSRWRLRPTSAGVVASTGRVISAASGLAALLAPDDPLPDAACRSRRRHGRSGRPRAVAARWITSTRTSTPWRSGSSGSKVSHAWTEDPPSRTRRFVTNVRVTAPVMDDEVVARSYLLIYRSRGDVRPADLLSAERTDRLRRERRRLVAGRSGTSRSTTPCSGCRTLPSSSDRRCRTRSWPAPAADRASGGPRSTRSWLPGRGSRCSNATPRRPSPSVSSATPLRLSTATRPRRRPTPSSSRWRWIGGDASTWPSPSSASSTSTPRSSTSPTTVSTPSSTRCSP